MLVLLMTQKWKRKGNTRRWHTHGNEKEKVRQQDDTHIKKKKKKEVVTGT